MAGPAVTWVEERGGAYLLDKRFRRKYGIPLTGIEFGCVSATAISEPDSNLK